MSLGDKGHYFQVLITATINSRSTAYFDIASIVVLVYDYLLTLKLEVGLVWGTPWNIGKVLFFLTRYSAFIDSALIGYFHLAIGTGSINTCRVLYKLSSWMMFWGIAIAEFILIFRTWAIWGQSRRVAIGLIVFGLSVGIPSMYLTGVSINSVGIMDSPLPLIQRCFVIKRSGRFLFLNYLGILLIETVILVFTLIKAVRHHRRPKSGLVSTLYRDGLLYYVYLNFCSIANVCTLAFPAETHGTSLVLLQRVLHSIFTARILLRLRHAGMRGRRDATINSTLPVLTTLYSESQEGEFLSRTIRSDVHELA